MTPWEHVWFIELIGLSLIISNVCFPDRSASGRVWRLVLGTGLSAFGYFGRHGALVESAIAGAAAIVALYLSPSGKRLRASTNSSAKPQ